MSTNPAILCVCTGNVCRSPAAERLLQHALGGSALVGSAGTNALVDSPMDPTMTTLLLEGVAAPDFRARQLDARLVRESDLVLVMERGHRSAVVELWPGAVRKCFTLREFARLVDGIESPQSPLASQSAFNDFVSHAARQRALRPASRPDADDVADPYRRSAEVYHEAMDGIRNAVDTILDALQPVNKPSAR